MITVNRLTKQYGSRAAVSDLNFSLETGKIYGLLGPNGAGKSTTLNMITGCLAPTEGTVTIDGLDIYQNAKAAKAKLGYLPEIPPLYPEMTVREYLLFVAEAKKIPSKQRSAALESVMTRTDIADVQSRLIKQLSKGYRQRIGIAQALLGDPEVVILDEPSVGLDPKQMMEIREMIAALKGSHTVILSSHILSEVQAVCDRVLIINQGKLIAEGTPEELEQQFHAAPRVELTVKADETAVRKILSNVPGICALTYAANDDGTARVTLETRQVQNEQIFLAFSQAGCPILQMTSGKASLEDIFLELTGDTATTRKEDENRDSHSET